MVCSRCKMVVKSEFEKLGLYPISVTLGEVQLDKNNIEILNSELVKNQLVTNLHLLGFQFIEDKKSRLIEKIKNLITDLVHTKNNEININLSEYLIQQLLQDFSQDYNALSNLFSEIENITIEHYFISQKIEKVKELITYNELTLSEIAFQLNYSSVAYLSNQFKKITGFTPTQFKQMKNNTRIQLEDL